MDLVTGVPPWVARHGAVRRFDPLDGSLRTEVVVVGAGISGALLAVSHAWTGTFAETRDSLPFVGFAPQRPGMFFALCYGGNGIVFSLIASEMFAAALAGRRHPCDELFRFGRPSAGR